MPYTDIPELFVQVSDKFRSALDQKTQVDSFRIPCGRIPTQEEFRFDQRYQGELGALFKRLDEIRTPVIYWFSSESVESAHAIKDQHLDFRSLRGVEHDRHAPAPNRVMESKIIYVGMRQGGFRKKDGFTKIAGRIYVHLGYYSKGSTQGLQLVHWCNAALQLHLLPLAHDVSPFLGGLEKIVAKHLRPVIGRH